MGDDTYTIKDIVARLETMLKEEVERLRQDIYENQRNSVTRSEFQHLQREVERVERQARDARTEMRDSLVLALDKSEDDTRKLIETLKQDITEDSRRNMTIITIVVILIEFALRYFSTRGN